jgi:hypothetical protein
MAAILIKDVGWFIRIMLCMDVIANMSYLPYLCLLEYSGVQHVLFTLFVSDGA